MRGITPIPLTALFLALGLVPVLTAVADETEDPTEQAHDALRAEIAEKRAELHGRWKQERTRSERQALREEARAYLHGAIADEIVPAWLGQPWTMAVIKDGLKPNAEYPGQPGRGISCSWFVVRVLQDAGLRFAGASRFAGTISIHFARSMVSHKKQVERYSYVTPAELEQKLAAKGDGLYVVGLNCHIGFIHVKDGEAKFMHSSYVDPYEVVLEPLTESLAIELSEDAGYVVAPLFHDSYLIDRWITGNAVPFKGPR